MKIFRIADDSGAHHWLAAKDQYIARRGFARFVREFGVAEAAKEEVWKIDELEDEDEFSLELESLPPVKLTVAQWREVYGSTLFIRVNTHPVVHIAYSDS